VSCRSDPIGCVRMHVQVHERRGSRCTHAVDLPLHANLPPTRPCDHSDLTEATLAGASISLVATGAILLLIVLVRPHGACFVCPRCRPSHGSVWQRRLRRNCTAE